MTYRLARPGLAGLLLFCAVAAPVRAIEVPDLAWANYAAISGNAGYYDSTTGLTGSALKLKLRSIIDAGDVVVGYDTLKATLPITDRVYGTTAAQNRMSTVYDFTTTNGVLTRTNISGTWDGAATWNREHVWPESRVGSNNDHDMFNIRPALTSTNGGRGNNYFGGPAFTGAARLTAGTNSQFFAGDVDKGDVARACLFMATRYSSLTINTVPTLSNGVPAANNDMGDLGAMLRWHYLDLPDNFERRRNQYIYSNPEKADTSTTKYSQRNRNPYIDHPEYVWAVWGNQGNDSQITVNTGAVGGASTKTIDFGRVIVGGTAPSLSTSVAISKTGSTPTTYSVTTTGLATADGTSSTVRTNVYNAFDYNAGTKTLPVGLTGVTTSTAGLKSGAVTIDNTDLTTLASVPNSGVNDGDDTVNLSLSVLDHSNASFASSEDADTLFLNFQAVNLGQTATLNFSLSNLLTASGYTAGLDLDSIGMAGDTGAFGTDLATFAALQAGTSRDFTATFTPTRRGSFYAEYTLGVSDENLSGATTGNALTIVFSGVTNARSVPEPMTLTLLPIAAMLLKRRRLVPSPGTPGEG